MLPLLFLCTACSVDPNDQKKTACYDIDVEVDDPLKAQMSNFLASTTNQQEIASLDVKVGPLPPPPPLGPRMRVGLFFSYLKHVGIESLAQHVGIESLAQ